MFAWRIQRLFIFRMDLLLVEFSEDTVSDVIKSVSSLADDVVVDSLHVLMSVFLDDFAIALHCLVCTLLFVSVCCSALSSSCVVYFLVLLFVVVAVWTVSVIVSTWAARTARLGV
jgi:hypothetical protein